MKSALIIHGTCEREEYSDSGYPSLSNSHWIPWLQKQLLIAGYHAETPEMPNAFYPRYEEWKRHFERFPLSAESILVGHSCGGGFLLRWLSETPVSIERVVLVAPWLDPAKRKDPSFFDFEIDRGLSARAAVELVASDDDEADINASVREISAALPRARLTVFRGYGHFCFSDMGTIEFPELRDLVLNGLTIS